jgi:hypothetical protein
MTITYNEIAKIVFSLRGVIFGGYVRDLLAGVEPKDMDIRFKKYDDIKDFLFLLLRSGEAITLNSETEYSAAYGRCIHYKVTVGSLSLDCLDRPVAKPLDFNVNGLEMAHDKILVPETNGSPDLSMSRILECIQKREAVMIGKADDYRVLKMIDRGWKITHKSIAPRIGCESHVDSIVHNPHDD